MEHMHLYIAGAVALFGIAGATILLLKRKINQATYCFILILSCFAGIWIGYSERAREFTVKPGELSMVLSEVQESQRDVQRREQKIKEVAILMGDFVTFIEGTTISSESSRAADEWIAARFQKLQQLTGEKIDNPFTRLGTRLANRNPNDEMELKKIWEDYSKDLEAEVKKLKSR